MKRVLVLAALVVLGLGCGLQARRTPSPSPAKPQNPPVVDQKVSETQRPKPPLLDTDQLAAAFPGVLFLHGPRNSNVVALTYDDGPDDYYTPQILAILQRFHLRATFFLLGEHVAQFPQVARQLDAAGMVIGNHTWDHPQLTKLSADAVRSEMLRTDAELKSVLGHGTRLMRPPYGDLNAAVTRELGDMGYDIIYWNDDSLDWTSLNAQQVESNILAHLRRGDIILQHSLSGGPTENLTGTVQALPAIITAIHREGLRIVTIPELLGIKGWRTRVSGPTGTR